ncbi:MAG: hypothetical protein AAGA84_05690 [Pseudomonadota bacterium]
MPALAKKTLPEGRFKNPDTAERWAWVQQAISFAEEDLDRGMQMELHDVQSSDRESVAFIE